MKRMKVLGRRQFLKLTGVTGAGLLLGFNLSGCGSEPEVAPTTTPTLVPTKTPEPTDTPQPEPTATAIPKPESPPQLNAFVSISPDDVVTLVCHRSEMGRV
jgi:hypothetical protein